MRLHWIVWLVTGAVLVALCGCAGDPASAPIAPAEGALSAQQAQDESAQTRYLWGLWACELDPAAGKLDIVPLREAAFHVNVVKFLEQGIPKLTIANLVIGIDSVEVDVRLKHPFPGLSEYTGFDVRGVFIVPGTVTGYQDSRIVHSAPSKSYLLNADGWTRWWNPNEFPVGNDIFSYVNGKLGAPFNGSNLSSTLNAYKYFCDDLGPLDGLDKLKPAHRGMFGHGLLNERHYSIHYDSAAGLVFNYAVDASWDVPSPNPPVAVPGDFPPQANAQEAYRIEPTIAENDLFYLDPVNKGGHAVVLVDVCDWQSCSDTSVLLDAPGFVAIEQAIPVGGDELLSTYQFDISGGDLNAGNAVRALIAAISHDATYGRGDIATDDLATYIMLEIPVSNAPIAPVVTAIDPDDGDIGEILDDVLVTGADFASNAEVTLIDDATGAVVIEAENEVVTDGTSITCDVDLSDPSVVTGAYDVRVTNPDSVLYGELDKGFSVNGPEHPWPNWGGGRYNQRASQYVGYGDEYASRSPKWVYEAPTYGGPRAGCIVANDGTIYICTSGASPSGPNCALHAINPDGSRKWTFEPNNPWISACPALDPEGYVYVAMGTAIWPSTYHDWVYKVDPDSGDDVWSCYLGDEPCYPHVVTVGLDGAVYVYTGSISDSVRLHRVNPDGTHDWTKTWGGIAYSYSYYMGIAVLDNGNLVCSGDTTGKIFCFQPDGDLVWEYQHTSYTYFPPAIGPEGNIYFTSFLDRTLTALDSGGGYKWSKVLMPGSGSIWASPAVDPNTGYIYIGTRTETSTGDYLGHFLCFDPDGNEIWHNQYLNTGIDSSAAVDANGDVYVALGNQEWPPPVIHELVKLDGATGDLIWESDDLGYILTGSPSIGADGTVYLPGYDNTHVLFAFGE